MMKMFETREVLKMETKVGLVGQMKKPIKLRVKLDRAKLDRAGSITLIELKETEKSSKAFATNSSCFDETIGGAPTKTSSVFLRKS